VVRFLDGGGDKAIFAYGDEIRVEASVALDGTLANPALSALIQDQRMIAIAGKSCPLTAAPGARVCTVQFSVRALFDSGAYFVTFRLEDRLGPTAYAPVDKRVGGLSFELVRDARQDFLGLVDLSMRCAVIRDEPSRR